MLTLLDIENRFSHGGDHHTAQCAIRCHSNGTLTMTCGQPTGRSCTSLISTYIGTHTSTMYNRSSSVTRGTTRADLAASASPLGPGHTASQAHRRRGGAASPARCRRCWACSRAGMAASSSSAKSTWTCVTCGSPSASPECYCADEPAHFADGPGPSVLVDKERRVRG